MDFATVQQNVAQVAQDFAAQRAGRQMRRNLDPVDFQRLAEAGYLLIAVPEEMGGLWIDLARSTRPICDLLRTLAAGDPCVALVSSMHPAVLSFWLTQPEVPEPYTAVWQEQRRYVAQTALDGNWWGTITSEPGSGGDVDLTRAVAKPDGGGRMLLSGQKHFGSGSGITSFMTTTAIPEGDDMADWFFMDVRGAPWDGSTGMKLVAEWDGHGMAATQSHAFEFTNYPVTRSAWPANMRAAFGAGPGALSAALFPAVIVGVAESAFLAARERVFRRRQDLRPYERVEWARIENEWWLISQAYEGMLRPIEERQPNASLNALQAKMAISELAESMTQRICRVIGGGSFHRASHFGAAFEDVRALGFLRPPWALAHDALLIRTWQAMEREEA